MSKRQPEGAVQAAPHEGAGGARGATGPTLTGKVVLITGASSGIGRAVALACAEAGADLALTYRANRRGADDTAESVRRHGRRAELLSVDVADELALETMVGQVRENVLGPGWIETAYGESLDAKIKERITRSIPLSRWGTPQEVAHVAVYLASDAASYVTGQMLMINGGAVV